MVFDQLYRQPVGVCNSLDVIIVCLIISEDLCLPYGTDDVDHLSADRTRLTGGEVAVIALLEVYAYFVCALHLEAVHSFSCLGDIDLVAVII